MVKKEKKRSLFERLTGGIRLSEDETPDTPVPVYKDETGMNQWNPTEEEATECDLALDVYQTASDIIIQTFVAGVKPEDLEINITRDMITVRGKRVATSTVHDSDFFSKELFWGTFSRTVSLPHEVEPDEAEAIERHGLLTIRLPKIDRNKKSNLKVKSV